MKRREPNLRQLNGWQQEIDLNGAKRISARRLLKTFGMMRRGIKSIEHVEMWLESQDPSIYASSMRYTKSLNEPVLLTATKLARIGHYAETEKSLMERFEAEIMPLGLLHRFRFYKAKTATQKHQQR